MKRIQTFARFSRLSLAVLSACVLFASCDLFTYKRPFADAYYDNNFIAALNFDQFSGADTSVPAIAVTGSWDCAYRYADGWSGTPVNYVTLADTGKTAGVYDTADGLSSAAKVFRLEKTNLITDGDFETGAGTWALTDATTGDAVSSDTESVASYVTSNGLNNKSMQLTLGSSTTNMMYSIVASSLVTGLSYNIDFRWSSNSGAPTSNVICVNSNTNALFNFDSDTAHAASSFEALASNTIQFRSSTWEGLVDDISICKSTSQQVRLLLKKTDTNPALEDFLYIFSLWVHADPSVAANTSPYNLDTISLKMYQVDGASTMSPDTTNATYTYSSTQSGWQKIYVRVNNGNLQINSTATGAVLQLIIDLDKSLPGRVLIAQPELRAYPDGY